MRKVLLVSISLLVIITSFTELLAKSEKPHKGFYKYQYTAVVDGIHYQMFIVVDANNKEIGRATFHFDLNGEGHWEDGWTYDQDGNPITKKMANLYSPVQDLRLNVPISIDTYNKSIQSDEKVVYAPKRMPKDSKLIVNVVGNKLLLSGYGTADIYEAQTNILVVEGIQVDGEKQRIDLPITFDYHKEYYILFVDWNNNFYNSTLIFNK